MSVNCKHWSDVGSAACGACALGLFGGRPSHGVCRTACKKREPIGPDEPPKPRVSPPTWFGHGFGSEIKKLIASLGIRDKGCGSCEALAKQWDEWGIAACEQRAEQIAATLTERAKKRNWLLGVGAKLAARPLVDKAIEHAKADPLAKP